MLTVALAAGGAAVAMPGPARAAVCSLAGAGSLPSCTSAGTVTLTTGTLTMVAPPTLTWGAHITGATQTIYDTLDSDTALDVLDLRGLAAADTGSGWNITATATAFGSTHGPIPDTTGGQVLAFGGGGTTGTAANVPSSVCVTAGGCVPATTSLTTFPLFIPTDGTTSVKIYNATAGTGTGTVQVGSNLAVPATNPAVWSVTLPATLPADTYTSTITTTVSAGP